MKRVIICATSVAMCVGAFAQTNFYVEPTIQAKYGVLSAESTSNRDVKTGRLYDLDCPSVSTPLFGLNIGASFNDGRQNLVLGINNDRSEFGYYYAVYDSSTGATIQRSANDIKVNYTNLRLTFEQRLLTPGKTNLYAVVGFGGTFNNRNQQKNINNPNASSILDRNGVNVSEKVMRTSSSKVLFSPTLTFGVKSDFYTKNGTYLFSSGAFLSLGLTDIATMTVNTDTNINGIQNSSVTNVSMRGSGLYLQLSRKINFNTAK